MPLGRCREKWTIIFSRKSPVSKGVEPPQHTAKRYQNLPPYVSENLTFRYQRLIP